MNDSLVTFLPSRRTIESPFTNEISFDIKTNSSEGMLLYIVEEQHNLTARRFDELVSHVALLFFVSQKEKKNFNSCKNIPHKPRALIHK